MARADRRGTWPQPSDRNDGNEAVERAAAMAHLSGKLFPAASDCVREKSVTMDGSMRDPDFLVRFSRVDPIDITAQR